MNLHDVDDVLKKLGVVRGEADVAVAVEESLRVHFDLEKEDMFLSEPAEG